MQVNLQALHADFHNSGQFAWGYVSVVQSTFMMRAVAAPACNEARSVGNVL